MPDHALTVWSGTLAKPPERDILDDAATMFRVASKSEATRRAYRSDVGDFVEWCNGQHLAPLPALSSRRHGSALRPIVAATFGAEGSIFAFMSPTAAVFTPSKDV